MSPAPQEMAVDGRHAVDLGMPALLAVRGADAGRYLNGQVTQDVRKLREREVTLPACVTDAKGRLQFRVWITLGPDGVYWVQGEPGQCDELGARLDRYLIADDAEVEPVADAWGLLHLTGDAPDPPGGVVARSCMRFGGPGTDWWLPPGTEVPAPAGWTWLRGDEFEDFRIRRGVPAWGRELFEGLLPPEAGLEHSDISYQKGCYIGQEVISRMKRAAKTNRRLVRLRLDEAVPEGACVMTGADGRETGTLTSVSPIDRDGVRFAMGFVKRDTTEWLVPAAGGGMQKAVPV